MEDGEEGDEIYNSEDDSEVESDTMYFQSEEFAS